MIYKQIVVVKLREVVCNFLRPVYINLHTNSTSHPSDYWQWLWRAAIDETQFTILDRTFSQTIFFIQYAKFCVSSLPCQRVLSETRCPHFTDCGPCVPRFIPMLSPSQHSRPSPQDPEELKGGNNKSASMGLYLSWSCLIPPPSPLLPNQHIYSH